MPSIAFIAQSTLLNVNLNLPLTENKACTLHSAIARRAFLNGRRSHGHFAPRRRIQTVRITVTLTLKMRGHCHSNRKRLVSSLCTS